MVLLFSCQKENTSPLQTSSAQEKLKNFDKRTQARAVSIWGRGYNNIYKYSNGDFRSVYQTNAKQISLSKSQIDAIWVLGYDGLLFRYVTGGNLVATLTPRSA